MVFLRYEELIEERLEFLPHRRVRRIPQAFYETGEVGDDGPKQSMRVHHGARGIGAGVRGIGYGLLLKVHLLLIVQDYRSLGVTQVIDAVSDTITEADNWLDVCVGYFRCPWLLDLVGEVAVRWRECRVRKESFSGLGTACFSGLKTPFDIVIFRDRRASTNGESSFRTTRMEVG